MDHPCQLVRLRGQIRLDHLPSFDPLGLHQLLPDTCLTKAIQSNRSRSMQRLKHETKNKELQNRILITCYWKLFLFWINVDSITWNFWLVQTNLLNDLKLLGARWPVGSLFSRVTLNGMVDWILSSERRSTWVGLGLAWSKNLNLESRHSSDSITTGTNIQRWSELDSFWSLSWLWWPVAAELTADLILHRQAESQLSARLSNLSPLYPARTSKHRLPLFYNFDLPGLFSFLSFSQSQTHGSRLQCGVKAERSRRVLEEIRSAWYQQDRANNVGCQCPVRFVSQVQSNLVQQHYQSSRPFSAHSSSVNVLHRSQSGRRQMLDSNAQLLQARRYDQVGSHQIGAHWNHWTHSFRHWDGLGRLNRCRRTRLLSSILFNHWISSQQKCVNLRTFFY